MTMTLNLLRSRFLRNAAWLSLGTTIGQASAFFLMPWLARILPPAAFGRMGYLNGIVAIMAIFATFRFEQSIVLPDSDGDAWRLAWLCLYMSLVFVLVLTPILFVCRYLLAAWINQPWILTWLPWLPTGAMFCALGETGYIWVLRLKRFRLLGANEAVGRPAQQLVSLAWGKVAINATGMVADGIGTTILTVCSWAYNAVRAFSFFRQRSVNIRDVWHFSGDGLRFVFRRYKTTSLFLTFSQGIAPVANMIPLLVLSSRYGDVALGFFVIATRIIGAPVQLIANAIGQSYRQRAAELYHLHGRFDHLTIKTITLLAVTSFIPFLMLYATAPWIISVFLGDGWAGATDYLRIFTVQGYVSFIGSPTDKAAVIVEAIHYISAWHLVRLLGYFALAVAVWVWRFDVKIFLWGMVLLQCLLYCADLVAAYVFSKGNSMEVRGRG